MNENVALGTCVFSAKILNFQIFPSITKRNASLGLHLSVIHLSLNTVCAHPLWAYTCFLSFFTPHVFLCIYFCHLSAMLQCNRAVPFYINIMHKH